jgi:hypothetical protein
MRPTKTSAERPVDRRSATPADTGGAGVPSSLEALPIIVYPPMKITIPLDDVSFSSIGEMPQPINPRRAMICFMTTLSLPAL